MTPISKLRASFLLIVIVLIACSFYTLLREQSVPPKSHLTKVEAAVDEVRFRRITEGPRYIRGVSAMHSWLQNDIEFLTQQLKANNPVSSGNPESSLSDSEIGSILKSLSSVGKLASPATSSIALYLKHPDDRIVALSAFTLSQIQSIPESVSSDLRNVCEKRTEALCAIALAVIERLGGHISSVEVEKVWNAHRVLENEFLKSLDKVLIDTKEEKLVDSFFEALEIPVGVYFYKFSPTSFEKLNQTLEKIGTPSFQLPLIRLLGTLRKFELSAKMIERLSHLMQYDPSIEVRKEALLTMVKTENESALSLARAYGHKVKNGDIETEPSFVHPFIEWAKENLSTGPSS